MVNHDCFLIELFLRKIIPDVWQFENQEHVRRNDFSDASEDTITNIILHNEEHLEVSPIGQSIDAKHAHVK